MESIDRADNRSPATGSIEGISFTDPAVHDCPYPVYDRLRDEAPVYLDPVTGHYVLTHYADVRKALTNFRTFSSAVGLIGIRECPEKDEIDAMYAAEGWPMMEQMGNLDPPEHKAKRGLADKAFARWNVAKAEPMIEEVANRIIDDFIDAGKVEFVSRFAAPLTIGVITQQLGVDLAGRDIYEFSRQVQYWSDVTVELIEPILSRERHIEITREMIKMQHFFAENARRVMASPDDTLLTQLTQTIVKDGEVDFPELFEIMKVLFVAGNETTRFGMAAVMRLFVENPDAAVKLPQNPDRIPQFVEEALRILSPVQTLFRRTTQDTQVHGIDIPKDSRVEMRFGAANRDPAVFPCPGQLQIDRPNGNTHLAFGLGTHSCIGMQLARAEIIIGTRCLLRRLSNFRLADPDKGYTFSHIYLAYGLSELEILFDKVES